MNVPSHPGSLRVRLATRLIGGLVLLAIVASVAAYAISTTLANRAYDRALFDDVQVLAQQVRWVGGGTSVSLSADALTWLLADEGEDVVFRVTDLGGRRVLAANGDLGPAPDPIESDAPNFRSTTVGGDDMRVAYVRKVVGGGEALVEIGETLRKRRAISQNILLGTVSLALGFIAVAVLLIWSGVGHALRPLKDLEAEAARRSLGSMTPLDAGAVPREVSGLVEAVNRMIERVRRATEAQTHFVSNAAHQLRTPIAGLRLQSQLAMRAAHWSDALDHVESVERSAAQCGHLIEQLLVLARAEAPDATVDGVRSDLVDLVREALERHLASAAQRSVAMSFTSDVAPALVVGHPVLLVEMISNVVDNALRHGAAGGTLSTTISARPDGIALAILDGGPGMDEEVFQSLFVRFSRSDRQRTGGAGLGLAIVKEIADRFHVRVEVRTRPAVEGTRVVLTFVDRSASVQPSSVA